MVEPLASRAGDIIWKSGGREPEVKKPVSGRHAHQPRMTSRDMATLSSQSLNFNSEVTCGCQVGGVLGGGFGKKNHECGVGLRDGERVKLGLLTQLREKRKKKHILPCF